MTVQVDIPGFGQVNAQNAATEATLKEVLRALQGKRSGGGSTGGAGGGGGGSGGGAGGMAGIMDKAGKSTGKFTDNIKNTTTALQDFGTGLKMISGMITGAFGMVVSSAQGLAMEFLSGSNKMSDFVQHIPLVGGALSQLTGLLEGQVENFRDLSEVGASFGNNIMNLTRAATEAGMGVSQFSEFIGQNSQNMMLLGGTTTEGAKQFGRLSRQIRNSDRDFQGMGFTFEALNEHTVEYMDQLARQGRLSGMSQAELRKGSEDYLMQIDRLAKVTGKSRKEAEALLKQQNAEANVLAMKMKLEGQNLKNFENNIAFVDSELPGFANAIKDMADGVAQTPLAQKLAATIPGFADLQKAMGDGTISQEEYVKRMTAFGPQMREFLGSMEPAAIQKLMGKEGFEGMLAGINEFSKMEAKYKNANFKEMDEEQKKRHKTTQQLADFETRIAEMRAKIVQTLLDSGVLDQLEAQFGKLLEWFTNNGDSMVSGISDVLGSVLEYGAELGKFLQDMWKQSNGDLGQFFSTVWEKKFLPEIKKAMGVLGETFKNWFGDFFKAQLGNLLTGVFIGLGAVLLTGLIKAVLGGLLAAILGPIVAPFVAIGAVLLAIFGWDYIKGFFGGVYDAFKTIGDWFGGLWDNISGWLPSWLGGKKKGDEPPDNPGEDKKKDKSWWNPFDDEEEKPAEVKTTSSNMPDTDTTVAALSPAEQKKIEEEAAKAGTNYDTTKLASTDSGSVNTSGDVVASLLQEQNRLLKMQINQLKGLQGNLLKGVG